MPIYIPPAIGEPFHGCPGEIGLVPPVDIRRGPDQFEQGGGFACWAHLVRQECSAITKAEAEAEAWARTPVPIGGL